MNVVRWDCQADHHVVVTAKPSFGDNDDIRVVGSDVCVNGRGFVADRPCIYH